MGTSLPKKAALPLLVALLGCPAAPSSRSRVECRVEGTPRRVVLASPDGRPVREAAPTADGTYALDVDPLELAGARLVIEGANGASTTTGPLADSAGVATRVTVGALALWPARVEAKREGERMRFSWAALPKSLEHRRYSLVFAYASVKDGERGRSEASIVSRDPEVVQTLAELAALFPDRDPQAKTLEVQARAYDAGDASGATWSGEPLSWPIPDDFPAAEASH
jgi:hypothetical protein